MRSPWREEESLPLPSSENHLACAFYATADVYAVAVLVTTRRLRQLGIGTDIDLVVLHHRVSRYLLAAMRELGLLLVAAPPPRPATEAHFRHSLLKLRIFQMTGYERVVFLDADSLPWTGLRRLFEVELDGVVAMPRAYWLPQDRYGTTALMVTRPSAESWYRLKTWIDEAPASGRSVQGDMDVVNLALRDRILFLPPELLCLNGDWGERDFIPAYGDPEAVLSGLQVVHFADLGKPWSYRPSTVRRLRPEARPRFYDFWDRWWEAREDVIRATPAPDRLKLLHLKQRSLWAVWLRDRMRRPAISHSGRRTA